MHIGVDIDGVIADFVSQFRKDVHRRYGVDLRTSDIRMHDLFQVLGIPESEAYEIIKDTLRKDLKAMPGARRALAKLKAENTISIITARPKELESVTKKWLQQNGIPYDDIVHSEAGNKYESGIKHDVVIEDHLRDAIQWIGVASTIMIFDHPWNKSLDVKKHFIRVQSWDEILKELLPRSL